MADALDSKSSVRKDVRVQLPPLVLCEDGKVVGRYTMIAMIVAVLAFGAFYGVTAALRR